MASVASDWQPISAKDGTIPTYHEFTKPIEKSQSDDRSYRIIRLANNLTATLIHDAKADKAAASLDVAVGHLSDPDDMPGLAHFCEHLLFMGTEQFPRENEYSEFLSKNGGSSNAYTSTTNTNYYFNVSSKALPGALERFSGFFHSPRFDPSCTSRELNAVDSEHKKNIQSDMWRIFQLNKSLSKEGNVWRKFGTGHRESLSMAAKALQEKGKLVRTEALAPPSTSNGTATPSSFSSVNSDGEGDGGAVGRETRRRLVEWWSKEYCAGRMHLCVVGRESLDELAAIVARLFSPILNRQADPLPMFTDHPFGENEKGTLVSVQTIMEFYALEISWPLAWQVPFWRHKPAHFLSHFIGHEGPGSLYSYLKNKGWAASLSAGPQSLARAFGMFKVTVMLTQEGFSNYKDVIVSVYKYIALLQASELPAWYQTEMKILGDISFRFLEKGRPDDYAVWVSEHMARPTPLEKVLSSSRLVEDWTVEDGEKDVRELINSLTIANGRTVLMARLDALQKIQEGTKEWQAEYWYKTPYLVERYDSEFVRQLQGPNDITELYLPGKNEFLPTNLEVDRRDIESPLLRPHLIKKTSSYSLWHKKDDQFWNPKASVVLEFSSPLGQCTPKEAVLSRLYADLVNDALSEIAYDASLAGLGYNFSSSNPASVQVVLKGYNDKMSVLLKTVLEKARTLVVKQDRLDVMKEQLDQDWKNIFLGQPYHLSEYYGRYLLTETASTIEERLAELASVTVDDVQQHIKRLLSKQYMKMLVIGNIFKDEAIEMADLATNVIGASPAPEDCVTLRALTLSPGTNAVYHSKVPNPMEPNSALTYYLYVGPMTDKKSRVTTYLLNQILSEPAFDVLRTKQQLGYIVSCSCWALGSLSSQGIRIVVQSERGPVFLESRVEAFLDDMKSVIEDMPAADFEQHAIGLQGRWREALKNIWEESNRYWTHIDSGYLDFLRRKEDADLITSVTKDDVLKIFLDKIHPSSPNRGKLSIHLSSQKPRVKTVSAAAAQKFASVVKGAGIDIGDQTSLDEAVSQLVTVPDFQKGFSALASAADVDQAKIDNLNAQLVGLVDAHPADGDRTDDLIEGATYITDMKAFKDALTPTEDPKPTVEWGDLPTAKF